MRVVFLWSMLVGYSLSALMGILLALSQEAEVARLLGCSLVVSLSMSVMFLLALFRDLGPRSLRWLNLLGTICTVPAALIWVALIFEIVPWGIQESMSRFGGGLTFFAVWSLYVGYCFVFKFRIQWQRLLVWFLFACSLFYLMLLEMAVIDEDIVEAVLRMMFGNEEVFIRLLVALIVLSSAITLALPVIWLIERVVRGGDAALDQQIEVSLSCPRCGLDQMMPLNKGSCARCRLEIRVKLDEPRCKCGFLLYRFEGEACPECGRPVPENLRWVQEGTGPVGEAT